jgi:hypothetical protein
MQYLWQFDKNEQSANSGSHGVEYEDESLVECWCHVVTPKLTDISEVVTASIIKASYLGWHQQAASTSPHVPDQYFIIITIFVTETIRKVHSSTVTTSQYQIVYSNNSLTSHVARRGKTSFVANRVRFFCRILIPSESNTRYNFFHE